jgi:hypothetical protein
MVMVSLLQARSQPIMVDCRSVSANLSPIISPSSATYMVIIAREDYLHKVYKDDDKRLQEKLANVRRANESLVAIFREQDTDNSGTIEYEEFLLTEAHALYSHVGRRARANSDPPPFDDTNNIDDTSTPTSTSPFAATATNAFPPIASSSTTYLPSITNNSNNKYGNGNGMGASSLLSTPLDDHHNRTLSPYSSANDSALGSGSSSPSMRPSPSPISLSSSMPLSSSSSTSSSSAATHSRTSSRPNNYNNNHHMHNSNTTPGGARINSYASSTSSTLAAHAPTATATTNIFGTTLPSLDDVILAGAPPHAGARARV